MADQDLKIKLLSLAISPDGKIDSQIMSAACELIRSIDNADEEESDYAVLGRNPLDRDWVSTTSTHPVRH